MVWVGLRLWEREIFDACVRLRNVSRCRNIWFSSKCYKSFSSHRHTHCSPLINVNFYRLWSLTESAAQRVTWNRRTETCSQKTQKRKRKREREQGKDRNGEKRTWDRSIEGMQRKRANEHRLIFHAFNPSSGLGRIDKKLQIHSTRLCRILCCFKEIWKFQRFLLNFQY